MKICPENIVKNILLFSIVLVLVLSNISAQDIKVFQSKFIGEVREIKPQKIIAVPVKPKITDEDKFIKSTEILFLDYFKQNQNIFSYIAVGDKIYKIKDLDISYATNKDEDQTIYIAYTKDLPASLISDLMYIHNIKNVYNGTITFKKNIFNIEEGSQLTIDKSKSVDAVVSDISTKYENNIDPGIQSDVSVTFKNKSFYPFVKQEISPVVVESIKDNKEQSSELAINDVWNTKSRAGELKEDRVGLDQNGTVNFKILSPVTPGEFTQKFKLIRTDGSEIKDSDFEIKFTVKNTGQKIGQVTVTKNNWVNVNDQPSTKGKRISFIDITSRYLILDETKGWTKIKYNGDKEGWIQSYYIKSIKY